MRQQDHEIRRLEQQLEAHRAAEELKTDEKDFARLQDRIVALQVAPSLESVASYICRS